MTPVEVAKDWVHVEHPSEQEIADLCAAGWPEPLVRHALDADEVARLDRLGDVTLIILRVPTARQRTVALGLIIDGPRCLTLSRGHTDVIESAVKQLEPGQVHHTRVLTRLIMATAESFLTRVRHIDEQVNVLEGRLSAALANREVLELLKLQQTLVRFTTALGSNQIMLERLARDSHLQLGPAERELLDDAQVEMRQAIEMVGVSTNLLSETMDAFASIISNNLNVVMKILTAITIVLTVPVLVSSLYGMNLKLPGQGHPLAFWLVLGGSGVVSLALIFFMVRRRWL